jgi:hypothetical protein
MAKESEGFIVQWENYVSASENLLNSPQVPSSLDIINLIKKVNPTRLTLSENDRERGYQLKNRLQNLLLEQYGDAFQLLPHPASPHIILIKHRLLPSIDACHADWDSLSSEAILRVETALPLYPARELPKGDQGKVPGKKGQSTVGALSPKKALKKAQYLLEKYDYTAAEEVLAGLRAGCSDDLQIILRGAAILLRDIGAYGCCIDTLLNQPRQVLKDRDIRELLAVAYHHNGSLPEARAILDELYPAELGLESLCAYAEISFKDGNLSAALELVRIAQGKEGFFSGLASLQKEIEAAMSIQAEPLVQKARSALQASAMEQASQLAREALDLYPNCQQARAIIASIESLKAELQRAELWLKLQNEPSGERRIPILTALLEQDREQKESIEKLLGEEKVRRRARLFDERLEQLRSLIRQESWPECFDTVTFLMRQPGFRERSNEILSLCPFFGVLRDNRQLQNASERSVRGLWLRFVKLKSACAAGLIPGSFETFEELRPWFGSCPEFQQDYLLALQGEQEKARTEIAALLAQSLAQGCPVSEVRRLYGCLRKRMPVLPAAERCELVRTMECGLARLIPEHDPRRLLEEYRGALQIGLGEKAAYLGQEIIDSSAREAVDAEFATAFRIAREPLTLEFSSELPIDLVSPLPLTISFLCGDRIFLKDGPDSYVMVDYGAKAACRITSPVFARARFIDCGQLNSLLLVEEKEEGLIGDLMWRAHISLERTAFTANFSMKEYFELEDGYSLQHVMSSGEKETDYYVVIKHDEERYPAKLLRKRLTPKGTVETLQLGNCTELKAWRCGGGPDRFLVGGKGETRLVNRNLSLKGGLSATPNIYKIDGSTGNIYGVESCMLTVRNSNLELIRSYDNAPGFGMFEPGRVHGISFQTDIALIVLGNDRQGFYNLRTNKFSQKIRVGRVLPSHMDGKWYCFDFDRNCRKLMLRDITLEIQTELEWRAFFLPRAKRKKMEKLLTWFNQHDTFVYRPGEWGDANPTGSGGI